MKAEPFAYSLVGHQMSESESETLNSRLYHLRVAIEAVEEVAQSDPVPLTEARRIIALASRLKSIKVVIADRDYDPWQPGCPKI